MIHSVLLAENTRRDFRRAVADGTLRAAVVPVAATEQHNEHLTMGHDARTVECIAAKAAERCRPSVVVTPVIPIGISGHWMDHPGTLTLQPETFTRVVLEVCDSLMRGGLRHILIVNGHGGNRRPLEAADLPPGVGFCCYWDAYTPEIIRTHMESGEAPGHAGEFETSTALAIFPESVRLTPDPYPEDEIHISDPQRAAGDRRFFQTARLGTAQKGHAMLEIAVDWLARRLAALARISHTN